jgi:hypothetical protein
MDRALQLHALLSSYKECVKHPAPLHLLFRATTHSHAAAYAEVLELHNDSIASVLRQDDTKSFRPLLVGLIRRLQSRNVFFLVDDIVFTESVDFEDWLSLNPRLCVPSLRLGQNLKWCYMENQPQPLPPLDFYSSSGESKLSWQWSDGKWDWNYPLSLDGHLFDIEEIRRLLDYLHFSSPNTFEASLQMANPFYINRKGVCYHKSKVVNIPYNKVQVFNDNRHGDVHQDDLLKAWHQGQQMDIRRLYGFSNQSAHQELAIQLVERTNIEKPPQR